MSAPVLSVVICSIGRSSPERTIQSVLVSIAAAGVAAEVVLVWQASDPPPPLPPGVRALHTIAAGLSHARNVGIAGSEAALVGFVDDDEIAAESWAGGLLAGVADGADAVVGPVEPMDDNGRPHCPLLGDEPRWIGPHERPWQVGTGGNMAAARELIRKCGGFDPRMGAGSFGLSAEDTLLIARLQRMGARLRWRPEMRVAHPTKTDADVLASRYIYGFGAGRVVRQLRSVALAARYSVDLGRAAGDALRRRSSTASREVAATTRGFAAGALSRDRWVAPDELLERLPDALRPQLLGLQPRGLPVPHTAAPHFLYAVGEHRVLHVYGAPGAEQREARRAREKLRGAGLTGIPELHGAVETATELWLVETRIPGRAAKPVRRPQWWHTVTDLLVALGRRTGPPVRRGRWWRDIREELPAALSPAWRQPVAAALEIVGDLPSVVCHGDVQPKNIVLDGRLAGLVDWDGALPEGPPGLDLMFLAVMARSGRPDAEPLRALAGGRDASGVPLCASLRAVGLEGVAVRAVALVAAATWAAVDGERAQRLAGRDLQPTLAFTHLLDEVGAALAPEPPIQHAPASRSISV
jgi:succinoglycan biosynthesis protein ExoM